MKDENYQKTLSFLFENLPMFQRVGAPAYKRDISNTIELCHALSNPHQSFRSIHVAGTNGKGSSSHFLASVLHEAGYKTGLYTSPHLKDFTERIRINGVPVDKEFVVDFVAKIRPEIDRLKPSFFEITVAMAFDYFASEKVDVAVIEVGVGGRLDSTNVITPVISLITNIGYDHKDLLGDTLPEIASEKAGIIKANTPVVISERQDEIDEVFIKKAKTENSPIRFASDNIICMKDPDGLFSVSINGEPFLANVALDLKGDYQRKNLVGVVGVCDHLIKLGFKLTPDQIKSGLEKTASNTGLKGRWQQLGNKPLIICDTGHNIDGIRVVLQQLTQYSYKHLHMVWGMVKDKDPDSILSLLPKNASYYFCQADIPRALESTLLYEKASGHGLTGEICGNVNEGIRRAKEMASADDLIFVGGSTFVVAEINGI